MNPLLDLSARLVIAHRGASADAPENTLDAFRLAVAQGCDAFELDVRLTRDGAAVLMHDPTLDRTCSRPGEVAAMTLAELESADLGVPTLRSVLRAFPEMPVLIELKVAEAQDEVARVLMEEGALDRCVVASFLPKALERLRHSPVRLGADRWDVARLVFQSRLGLRSPKPRCLLYAVPWRWKHRIEVPRPRFIAASRGHGCPVHVWTVDDPTIARELWRRGASGIITNRPGVMRTAAGQP